MKNKHTKKRPHKKIHSLYDLITIMRRLRSPRGCAWDREQNHESLLPYLFEEAHEVKTAVRKKNYINLQEELGDVLLQILFHAQIASEHGRFTMQDVLNTLADKLIRRHPHVFGNLIVSSTKDIITNWHKIKKTEKKKQRY
ncbi:MAG: MazG family protein [bacterium]